MRSTAVGRFAAVGVAMGIAGVGVACAQPVDIAAGDGPKGVLRFAVTGTDGAALPSRVTFLDADEQPARVFTNFGADPLRLAVRSYLLYSIDGSGEVTVPAGTYTVLASRGLEYGIEKRTVTIEAGKTAAFDAVLEREVDTRGWVSGDYHLHVLTYSGHGDSNMPERIISLAGEGVEFAVATDHNHNTDYGPTIREVGAESLMTSVVGNEVSTPVGHFNAFPLDAGRLAVPSLFPSAVPLFEILREEPNEFGITPVIQVNHPRWADIHYFGIAELDPIFATSGSMAWSEDFDTIEIFNENEGWGYYDTDADVPTNAGTFGVLRDWFNLLNRGHRYAAVGNSDSHDVGPEFSGVPRNYTPSSTDDPAAIDPREVASMLRSNRVFTTSGPFVTFTLDGVDMGGELTLGADGERSAVGAELEVTIQRASWIDVDVLKVVVNGDVVDEVPVPLADGAREVKRTLPVRVPHDSWVTVLVEGDESLAPVVHDQGRPILPLAVCNPVWVDADGDGVWTSPIDRARARFSALTTAREVREELASRDAAADRALLAHAAAETPGAMSPVVVAALLSDDDRYVKLSAARAAEALGDAGLTDALRSAFDASAGDGHLRLAVIAALEACGSADADALIIETLTSGDTATVRRFGDVLERSLGGRAGDRFVREWMFAGYFPRQSGADVVNVDFGPESDASAETEFGGAKGGTTSWRPITGGRDGRVDLLRMGATREDANNAISYLQCWLASPDDREVLYTLGSDDGARLWVNGEVIYEEVTSRGASPLQHIGTMRLRRGANRVVFKVENGGGDHAAYFRVLDDEIEYHRDMP